MAGPRVELLEVVGGEVKALRPIESEPLEVALDRVDVLHPLLCRVRIVEAHCSGRRIPSQDRNSARSTSRVQGGGSVRLGWKARDYDTRAAGFDIRRYDTANEIAGACVRFSAAVPLRHLQPQA